MVHGAMTPRFTNRRPSRKFPILIGLILLLCFLWLLTPFFRGNYFSGIFQKSTNPSSTTNKGNDDAKNLKNDPEEGGDDGEDDGEKKGSEFKVEEPTGNILDSKLDDPMAEFIVGYPTEPLSLVQLRLCDDKQTIILQGSYVCPTDPSCLACVPPKQVDRFKELNGAFRNPELEKQRKIELKRDFEGQHTVVMFTFNFAHSDLFLNWACSVKKLGIDPREFTLVIPCDERAHALVAKLGFKILNPAWQKLLSKPIKQQESYWGQDHADINNIALFAMTDLVELGFHVFVHDADVAWTQDPFPFFKKAIQRRDFLGMLAPFWTSMGPVNTGLLYIAPTFQSKLFLKSMENAAIVKGTSDQRLWNSILRHYSFQQLEWRLLPQNIIYKYSGRHAKAPDKTTLLMHAVGTNKRLKLVRYNLWLLQPDCPYYDEESANLSKDERARPPL